MVEKLLNKSDAEAIFEREAFLIGSCNAIPRKRVAELLGDEAAAFPRCDGASGNVYGLGDGKTQLPYLYLKGFLAAVSYFNITKYGEEI